MVPLILTLLDFIACHVWEAFKISITTVQLRNYAIRCFLHLPFHWVCDSLLNLRPQWSRPHMSTQLSLNATVTQHYSLISLRAPAQSCSCRSNSVMDIRARANSSQACLKDQFCNEHQGKGQQQPGLPQRPASRWWVLLHRGSRDGWRSAGNQTLSQQKGTSLASRWSSLLSGSTCWPGCAQPGSWGRCASPAAGCYVRPLALSPPRSSLWGEQEQRVGSCTHSWHSYSWHSHTQLGHPPEPVWKSCSDLPSYSIFTRKNQFWF